MKMTNYTIESTDSNQSISLEQHQAMFNVFSQIFHLLAVSSKDDAIYTTDNISYELTESVFDYLNKYYNCFDY